MNTWVVIEVQMTCNKSLFLFKLSTICSSVYILSIYDMKVLLSSFRLDFCISDTDRRYSFVPLLPLYQKEQAQQTINKDGLLPDNLVW